jgi:hypothetical protein
MGGGSAIPSSSVYKCRKLAFHLQTDTGSRFPTEDDEEASTGSYPSILSSFDGDDERWLPVSMKLPRDFFNQCAISLVGRKLCVFDPKRETFFCCELDFTMHPGFSIAS